MKTTQNLAHRKTLTRRVHALLIQTSGLSLQPDEIDPDAPLFGSGLGLDSVDAVELVVAIEREFGLRLPDRYRPLSLRSPNAIIDQLELLMPGGEQ